MDRKVVLLKDLQLLEHIASISAFITIETEQYLMLAMAVENYVNSPDATNFKIMHDVLQKCLTQYPKFNKARKLQIQRLVENGNLKKVINGDKDEVEVKESPLIPEKIPTDNGKIIPLFPSKPVDKDD